MSSVSKDSGSTGAPYPADNADIRGEVRGRSYGEPQRHRAHSADEYIAWPRLERHVRIMTQFRTSKHAVQAVPQKRAAAFSEATSVSARLNAGNASSTAAAIDTDVACAANPVGHLSDVPAVPPTCSSSASTPAATTVASDKSDSVAASLSTTAQLSTSLVTQVDSTAAAVTIAAAVAAAADVSEAAHQWIIVRDKLTDAASAIDRLLRAAGASAESSGSTVAAVPSSADTDTPLAATHTPGCAAAQQQSNEEAVCNSSSTSSASTKGIVLSSTAALASSSGVNHALTASSAYTASSSSKADLVEAADAATAAADAAMVEAAVAAAEAAAAEAAAAIAAAGVCSVPYSSALESQMSMSHTTVGAALTREAVLQCIFEFIGVQYLQVAPVCKL
jgi:hypothetical protein